MAKCGSDFECFSSDLVSAFLLTFYWPKQITGQADIDTARKHTSSQGKSCKQVAVVSTRVSRQ